MPYPVLRLTLQPCGQHYTCSATADPNAPVSDTTIPARTQIAPAISLPLSVSPAVSGQKGTEHDSAK